MLLVNALFAVLSISAPSDTAHDLVYVIDHLDSREQRLYLAIKLSPSCNS